MATIAIILETRRTLSDGTHPVKLRVTHKGERKYYTLKVTDKPDNKTLNNDRITTIGLSVEAWERVQGKNPRKQYLEISDTLEETKAQTKAIIKKLDHGFTFSEFEKQFFNIPDETEQVKNDLLQMLMNRYKELYKQEKYKTAEVYKYAARSIHVYKNGVKKDWMNNLVKLDASEINIEWLNDYEMYLRKKTISPTTISMYIRAVRAVLNRSGRDVSSIFGLNKYEIPPSEKRRLAIPKKHVELIYKYDALPNSTQELCRDFWILSYMCGGMNIKDLAQLKYKNIDGESIRFIRQKRAHKKQETTVIPITRDIGRLIDKYKRPFKSQETYLLKILDEEKLQRKYEDMTAKQREVAKDNLVRLINDHIKVIAANIGISTDITTYTARHTCMTVLRNAGFSALQIGELSATSPDNVGQSYASPSELDQKRKMAETLTNWNDG